MMRDTFTSLSHTVLLPCPQIMNFSHTHCVHAGFPQIICMIAWHNAVDERQSNFPLTHIVLTLFPQSLTSLTHICANAIFPQIIRMIGTMQDGPRVILIMEHMSGGDLENYTYACKSRYNGLQTDWLVYSIFPIPQHQMTSKTCLIQH